MRALTLLLLTACAATPSTDPEDTGETDDTSATAAPDPADADGDGVVSDTERLDFLGSRGPWRVGARFGELTYDDPISDAPRTLKWTAWYPTDATSGTTAEFFGTHAPTDVLQDAAVGEGSFPVAVFSHGHQGNMDNCSTLSAHLASHGWVVLAPEHTGNTLTDLAPRTTEIYLQRPGDVSAMLDELPRLTDLSDHVTDDVFAFGHSFGGYTTFVLAGANWDVDRWDTTCREANPPQAEWCSTWSDALVADMRAGGADDRIVAAASLSGGNYEQLGDDGLGAIDRPFLLVSGGVDAAVTNAASSDPIWAAMPADTSTRVDIAHADHFTYTAFAGAPLSGSSPEALEPARGHRIVHTYVLAFAEAQVLGQDGLDAVLDGTLVVDEDVTLSTK